MALLRLLAAALLAATATLPAFAEGPVRLLVHAGRLVDGVSPAAREMVTVLVEGDRIADVVDGYRLPASGEKVLDLSGSTVLPGFIDLHVHLGMEMSPASYIERFTWNPADLALRAAAHARTTLRAGFTTVRNLGDGYNETISLRDAIRQGWVEGPRIYTAGKSISTTGGHVDPTNGWCDLIEGDPGPKEGVANGADEMAKAVRQRYKDRADLVKIAATGGVLSLARSPNAPQFTEDEVAAVVRTARDYGLPVAVHAHGLEGMKRAIRAGVDSIEHGTQMDEETMRLLSEKAVWYVPTLSAGIFVGEKAKVPGYLPEVVRPKAELIGAQIRATVAKAVAAGVPIAFGTDAGVGPHGENGK
jgi:imidazolonepropionase-like amidohydrolase